MGGKLMSTFWKISIFLSTFLSTVDLEDLCGCGGLRVQRACRIFTGRRWQLQLRVNGHRYRWCRRCGIAAVAGATSSSSILILMALHCYLICHLILSIATCLGKATTFPPICSILCPHYPNEVVLFRHYLLHQFFHRRLLWFSGNLRRKMSTSRSLSRKKKT